MSFIPLHVNSTYTILESGLSLEKLINQAKNFKLKSVSLTDYNSFLGAVKFSSLAKENNIKPILGLDLYIEDNLITFIIKNETGFKNLIYLSSIYGKDEFTLENIKKHNEGLIGIICTKKSNLVDKLNNSTEVKFAYYLKKYFDAFEEFYIGLEIYNENDKLQLDKLKKFLLKRDYSLIAFPLIKYLKKEDEIICCLASAIKENKTLDENFKSIDGDYYFRNEEELKKLYTNEELNKTEEIANKINFELIRKRGKLIKFSDNSNELLKKLCYEMLEKKITITNEYKTRLEYELSVINKMGYSDYFLIVMDYVKFAKDNNIYVGPGRGSAGGSLVAYALDIISIDPLKANLIFERFLNEGRKTMPDIDVDFEDVRRDEVYEYIKNKYGIKRVGKVITTQTIKAKQALRDIGRIYNIKNTYIEVLCKSLGDVDELRLGYKTSPTFRRIVDSDKYYLSIVTMASKIEGLPRQTGLHAAGIIIDDSELSKSIPTYIDRFGNITSQFEKDDLELLGFLKMDILGLKNLTVVKSVINTVNSKGENIVYNDLPWKDKDSIKLISTGQTLGLFQLESKGMIRTIKDFKPETFDDIVSLIALFRPGPMQFIPQYIARKKGKEKITYPCKKIENILKSTYGIIVYQEQIMEIVRTMANFSYSEADSFRRAISKKDSSKMNALKSEFINGCLKNNNSKEESEKVFSLIYKFANYGFNKSHAYVYAKLACQMAYLKLHYPIIFYAAILDNGEHFNDALSEIRKRKIPLKFPDINIATFNYTPLENSLVIPLISIKGILSNAVSAIIKERNENGLYKDFIDFILRNYKNNISTSNIIKLIEAGSFDSFKLSRSTLKASLDNVINYAKLRSGSQLSLDDSLLPPPHFKNIKDNEFDNVNKEVELLGFALSKSPIDFYIDEIKKENASSVSKINSNLKYLKIAGIIKSIRRIKTRKSNKTMCFITLSDDIDDINVVIFPETYLKYEEELYNAKIIIVDAKHEFDREEFIARDIKILV